MKRNADPSDPKYYIAKLLMNSLYGRFGMNPDNEVTKILSHKKSEKIIMEKNAVDIIPLLDSDNVIVKYKTTSDESSRDVNVSVIISAAISAYSRMIMSDYLVKYADNMYSIDTDGIKLDCELHPDEVDDKKLG
jgi:hypothetical protein